jgi:hypothetical protein
MNTNAFLRRPHRAALVISGLLIWGAAAPGVAQERQRDPAQETCDTYPQDVAEDIRLLESEAVTLEMAGDAAGAVPGIEVGRAYQITLHPQADVKFVTEPSRIMLDDGSYAGFVKFAVPETGRYRFSFTGESWVDVVAEGETLDVATFAGRLGCIPLRKLVDYHLEGGTAYVLMLSGGSARSMTAVLRPVEEE